MVKPRPWLEITDGDTVNFRAETAIMVPLDSIHYPDKLGGLTTGSRSDAKHTFHALSQIALYDFEDENLYLEQVPEGRTLRIKDDNCDVRIEQGLLILRDLDGKVFVVAHDHVDVYRLLKFAHRQCTRWVRLDI